jgi:hypothetical protein
MDTPDVLALPVGPNTILKNVLELAILSRVGYWSKSKDTSRLI